jgi:hypothetical protein
MDSRAIEEARNFHATVEHFTSLKLIALFIPFHFSAPFWTNH